MVRPLQYFGPFLHVDTPLSSDLYKIAPVLKKTYLIIVYPVQSR
jgi:hypothetical protein